MPTWGISNMMSPNLWAAFSPYAWTSNYGYETQMNIFPNTMSYEMAMLSHGMLNPNHVSQWNPIFSVPVQNNFTNPLLMQQGINAAYEAASAIYESQVNNSNYSQTAQTLSAIKSSTEAYLKNAKLTDEQKQKLQTIITKAEEYQKKLEEIKKEMTDASSNKKTASEKLQKLSEEVKNFAKETVETVKAIKEEINEDKPEGTEDKPEGTEDKPEGTEDKPEGNDDKPEGNEGKPEGTDDKTKYSAKYTQQQYITSANAQKAGEVIAKAAFEAIDGWGTDEDKLEAAMNNITKDNVMEILDKWNSTHAKEFDGESLLESIYGDISSGDTREKYTRKLMEALAEKAKEANVDISAEYNQLNEELKAWWRDDEKIYELINTIHKNLGGREYKS